MPLLDLKDFQALLVWVGENKDSLSLRYGNVSVSSICAIERRLLVLENQGGAKLFGEPALALTDIMAVDSDGRGRINVLAADTLMSSPRLYSTFLLWLLSELFEELPEVGNPDKPKLVFFFDEAHLLFEGAPKVLVDKVEQVARLIRSKGVGSISSLKILMMCPRIFWDNLATEFSMLSVPLQLAIKKHSGWPRKPTARTLALTLKQPSEKSGWARL